MSNTLQYILTLNGSQFNAGARTAQDAVGRLASRGKAQIADLSRSVSGLYQQLNGFSAISQLAVAAGGMALLRNALDANLEFEKKILEMKQLADMTQAQAAGMRDFAIKKSGDLLSTPQEIAEGMRTLANAGMKYDAISGTIEEAARAALVFRSTISDIANMDFDIQQKFNIDPSRMKTMHEMLYYHSKQGRFEAKSLSSFAPDYLNEMRKVGIGGESGLNFAGALTQVMQQIAPATQPGEVATLIKHGLGHMTMPHYVKGLAKFGIDIKKFMPNGKFYGEGGVQGMLDLADEMKKKGLDNPFKMGKAGFREQYTQNFWRQMMDNSAKIREQMQLATSSAGGNVIDRDVKEMKNSNFGKLLEAKGRIESAKTGESATKATGWWSNAVNWASEHPSQAAVGGLGVLMGGRLAWKGWNGRGQGAGGLSGGLPGGAQPVFVTNWPGVPNAGLPGAEGSAGGGAAKAGKFSRFGAGIKGALKFGAPVALAFGAADAYSTYSNDALNAEQKKQEYKRAAAGTAGSITGAAIGGGIGALFGGFGAVPGALIGGAIGNAIGEWMVKNDAAGGNRQPIVVETNLHLDGQVVAKTVNEINGREASRQ